MMQNPNLLSMSAPSILDIQTNKNQSLSGNGNGNGNGNIDISIQMHQAQRMGQQFFFANNNMTVLPTPTEVFEFNVG